MKQEKKRCSVGVMRESFIAANGYGGFRSRYDEVYRNEEFDRLFVIAGGPGTGKSRTMKEIALAAQEMGADVEYIYCSSDPSSLDGVIAEKGAHRVAILDGTAPHRRSADLPGVKDELINLGDFWDADVLLKERGSILDLTRRKGEAYDRTYRYLAVAGEASALLKKTLEKCMYRSKMEGAIDREIKKLQRCSKPEISTRYISAFGMRGYERLPLPPEARNVVSVSNEYGSASLYLSVFCDKLKAARAYTFRIFPSCFADDEIEGFFLPQNNIAFLEDTAGADRQINMRRFLDAKAVARNRADIRCALKVRARMLEEAQNSLHEVGEAHFALEKIYGEAMNFQEKEKYTKKLIARVLSFLDG